MVEYFHRALSSQRQAYAKISLKAFSNKKLFLLKSLKVMYRFYAVGVSKKSVFSFLITV